MQKKILALLLVLVMLLPSVLTACQSVEPLTHTTLPATTEDGGEQTDPQIEADRNCLQILRSDLKLTQEQTLSRIKAKRLIENGGYLEDDPIVAIVKLPQNSLIGDFLEDDRGFETPADYAASAQGQKRVAELQQAQDRLISDLTQAGLISDVVYRYHTVMNAVAVQTTYGQLEKINGHTSVAAAILSDTYNRPQAYIPMGMTDVEGTLLNAAENGASTLSATSATDASAIVNPVDVYPTGIFNSDSARDKNGQPFTGKGTAVAVLDSGFDCEHTAFSRVLNEADILITMPDVDRVFYQTRAKELCNTLEVTDVYYSRKIPFVFDYADKDGNVNPFDSEHGTHVAGIIGGLDETITGIAVDTQLVLLKVFPDLDEGGKTEDILAALEDAVLLKVDAINMSLGSSCGFSREADKEEINAVYDSIKEAGISLITAASNSYSSAFGGEQGNTGRVTNPDTATVGSPSSYVGSLSVASISGTKSKYMIGNDSQVIFFEESNAISGKPNDFFGELGIGDGEGQELSRTFEYVTIPGVGLKANYAAFPEGYLNGKIALVRRGDSTFEDKALQAKNAGAVACIIYNNVEGSILMSMGKSDHIPTISISKENGTLLAERESGTITISYANQAGPFMSDFSSWGPTPDLKLKPEITAHGGNIKSAVPGGGYDEQSGTSMATPNLCGLVVLIRQFLKEKYPDYSYPQISVMANQMLMSTATIVQNEEGNPYSPRKQGAGLASLYNVVNTPAYLTVEGIDRSKLELGDDPTRQGVYSMVFQIVNLSDQTVEYDLSLVALTESVSRADKDFVAEKSYVLGGATSFSVKDGELNGQKVSVAPGKTATVSAVYTMSEEDKTYITDSFPYGMYVEGFVKLTASKEGGIDLNIPFLAFFGDWTEAPMFDRTYYEVESEAHNAAIDEEDKLKADYYATTPYGSYYYNYIIPLGTYLYDVDTETYDAIPAVEEHIAISDSLGTIDGLSAVYAGLLRNAKTMTYTITDKVTGEEVYTHVVKDARKAYSNGATPLPNYEYLRIKSAELGLVNNRSYTFTMKGELDYRDGGVVTNARNSFSFDFMLDNEAPVLKEVSYEKVYDKTQKKDRFYLTMTIYDNHYTQSITPIIFTSSSSYTFLSENPIPVYSEKGKDSVVRFEITDYLDKLFCDEVITSALAFSIDDYALNSNIYLCQLPGTRGDFTFTKDGSEEGTPLSILSVYEDSVVDLTQYLYTADTTLDEGRDYLRYLEWVSANERVATVFDGQVRAVCEGRTTVTVREQLDGKEASLIINVRKRPGTESEEGEPSVEVPKVSGEESAYPKRDDLLRPMSNRPDGSASKDKIKSIEFTYFDTIFAYSRAAQTSKIGDTGDRMFVSGLENGIEFYPGEQVKLHFDIQPWYVADKYTVTYSSTNPNVATVDEDGTVKALKKGSTTIMLRVSDSNLVARISVTVNSEFVVENRTLVAYKGLGGKVVIPEDEGILYIGAYAFCLYDTDRTIELTDEDYDANKIPAANTSITEVIIPNTVEEIQKYAFYNCADLVRVEIPDSVRFIREFAFAKDEKLESVNLSHVEAIGQEAFSGCSALKLNMGDNPDLGRAYSIGTRAFQYCTSIEEVELTHLRNTGKEAFRGCSALTKVTLGENTRLSEGMFAKSGVTEITIYEKLEIPRFCFADCDGLKRVVIASDHLLKVGFGAFCESDALVEVVFKGAVDHIDEQAFYACTGLKEITLPNSPVILGNYAFYKCESLATLRLAPKTRITEMRGAVFQNTAITTFVVDGHEVYSVSPDGRMLMADTNTASPLIVLAATGADYPRDLILDEARIGAGAFCGVPVVSVTFRAENPEIGNYAFAGCESLTTVTFDTTVKDGSIGLHAFNGNKALSEVNGLENVTRVGDYAFANTDLSSKNLILAERGVFGEGVFFSSGLKAVTIGRDSSFGLGAFQRCLSLNTVIMPAPDEKGLNGVTFGKTCFAYDAALRVIDLSGLSEIPEQGFFGCRALTTAVLTMAKTIGNYAFAECSALNTVSFPMVETIGMGAFSRYETNGGAPTFSGTDGTLVMTFPSTLQVLGDGAFIGCEGITEVDLSAVTALEGLAETPEAQEAGEIWNYLFAYCKKLKTVTLPSVMHRIGRYAFAGCEELSSINLENVEVIDEYAFTSCGQLKSIDIAKATSIGYGAFASSSVTGKVVAPVLETLGDYAFQGADITELSAPLLSHIGDCALERNKHMESFVFSPELSHVGSGVFLGCESLSSLFLMEGGEKSDSGEINDYAHLVEGILYTRLPSGEMQLSAVPGGKTIEELVVREGTVRIDLLAGNENKSIRRIVLPESLLAIGNYAFNGYEALEEVEFRSFLAPALESSFISSAKLEEEDPGFSLLHNQFDLFGLELCYFHFKDLVGRNQPIRMVLPKNPDASGYDAIVYQGYFGKVADAARSDIEAMDTTTKTLIECAVRIRELSEIGLEDEGLINRAVAAMNAFKQDPAIFGYDEETWSAMMEGITKAKVTLSALKLERAPQSLRDLQTRIQALPDTYTRALRGTMDAIASELAALSAANRNLLDMERYLALLTDYEADRATEEETTEEETTGPIPDQTTEPGETTENGETEGEGDAVGLTGITLLGLILGGVLLLGGVTAAVLLIILRRKKQASLTGKEGE